MTSGNAHLLVVTQGVAKLDAFPKTPVIKVGQKKKTFYKQISLYTANHKDSNLFIKLLINATRKLDLER